MTIHNDNNIKGGMQRPQCRRRPIEDGGSRGPVRLESGGPRQSSWRLEDEAWRDFLERLVGRVP